MGWLSKEATCFFSRPMSPDTHRTGLLSVFSPPRMPTISMIFGGAMKGMAQPHSRRVGIATVMNLSNPPVSMFFLFFFEETLDSNKHLGPCNQFIFCFSLTTTTHHLSSQISSELILSPLDWDLCIFLDTKKTRTEKCVYPMSHFSPDLDIQFFKHLEQVEGL